MARVATAPSALSNGATKNESQRIPKEDPPRKASSQVGRPGNRPPSWLLKLLNGLRWRTNERAEARERHLLDELEGGWGEGEGEGADGESDPDLAKLDSGWEGDIDDLFKDEDEEEANEAPLPDERIDPVAYAEAKKALEERQEQRRLRRKAKLEAKRARYLAKKQAVRGKQKQKQARPKSRAKVETTGTKAQRKKAERAVRREPTESESDVTAMVSSVKRPDAKSMATPIMTAKGIPWKLVALALLVFVAAAAAIAAVMSR